MNEKEITWDLSVLYPSIDLPKIKEQFQELKEKASKIENKYKGKINTESFSAKDAYQLIETMETFLSEYANMSQFASLSFSANMTLSDTQSLFNISQDASSEIEKQLAFVDLELGKWIYDHPEFMESDELAVYEHYLEKLKNRVPHQLSEVEEQLIIEKDQFGVNGWSQLQSKWLNTRMFEVEVEGEKKQLSYGQANGLFTNPDRATRESAYRSIYTGLGKDEIIFSSALRNVCGDWMQIVNRRNFKTAKDASYLINDVSQEIIDNLMTSVENNAPLYQRYLRLKAKIMELPIPLQNYDVVAPITTDEVNYSWEEAREIVTKAYEDFDEEYATCVKNMFELSHIDASPRFGKRNGAFCSGSYMNKTSFILQTYTGSLDNIYTLAHELGHATHNYYSYANQTRFNSRAPMVIAETASIFGELLLTDMLLKKTKNDEEKKAILCNILDGAGMAIFQVSARYWFEESLYEAIKEGTMLDGEAIAERWEKGRDKVYGEAMEYFEEMKWEWTMKPHYYMPNFRFYNYPYTFAQLFVYALYRIYQEEGQSFIPKFKNLLSSGGSKSPEELGKEMGVDISDPDFWKKGMEQYEYFVDELEKLL